MLRVIFICFQHDNTVAALCRVLGVFNNLHPVYLATVILEQYQQGDSFFVRVLYDNHTADGPHLMKIPGKEWMLLAFFFFLTF